MKILYITHLFNTVSAGLTWSVPASIEAQSKYDEVYWINTTVANFDHWKAVKSYHQIVNPSINLFKNLPDFIKKPDIVVFEGFYDSLLDIIWGIQLKQHGIPYIIVPRSALTFEAMNNHAKIKKRITHWLFYNRYIRNAKAIQYLTVRECKETQQLFGNDYFIVPNGISQQIKKKVTYNKNSVKGIFIGRLDIHQKGLDVLLDALESCKIFLIENGFSMDVYGPQNQDFYIIEKMLIEKGLNDIIYLKGETRGPEKENALLSADVFFLTSRFEGHPMGLIEALSYGLPCFITPGSNMGDEVKDAKCGWVAEFSKKSIAENLKRMIEEKEHFETLGKRAIELSKFYDWDRLAEKFHHEVTKLLVE